MTGYQRVFCWRISNICCLTMALSVVGFLLTLASLSAASAPDCEELVQPYMPEEPDQVGPAYFGLLLNVSQQWRTI